MSKRDFKGVWIPSNIWLDSRLSAIEKIILIELDSRGEKHNLSNKQLAEFCKCSEIEVSTALTKLYELGYLHHKGIDSIEINPQGKPLNGEIKNNVKQKKAEETNKFAENCGIIIDYLNAAAGTRYKSTSKITQSHIRARLAEGYTVEDFKRVIDLKCSEWIGTNFERYIRPETLFGTKFESYLNTPKKEYSSSIDYNKLNKLFIPDV